MTEMACPGTGSARGIDTARSKKVHGDPVNGLKHIDVMKMFNDDPAPEAVVMISGGDGEVAAR